MKQLFLFNPDNDMALASFSPYYMPPASAKKMAADLSALPAWFAEGEDATVLLQDSRAIRWMEDETRYPLKVSYTNRLSPSYIKICPWGWNPSLRRQLLEGGISETVLPSEDDLKEVRALSSRQLAVEVLSELQLPDTLGESFLFHTDQEVLDFLSNYPRALLKAPWSGSGKGIRLVWSAPDQSLLGWIRHVLHTQGGIVGEPFYNKVLDFAMEFRAVSGHVKWIGYSLFDTDHRGAYKGNRLLGNTQIEEILANYVPSAVLKRLANRLQDVLEQHLGNLYEGYLGVDMMICQQEKEYAVHPCVEVNLRMNMGVVARLFYDHYVVPSSQGNFVVTFYTKAGDALAFHHEQVLEHPLCLCEGKIQQGYLSLTPVFPDTTYQAYVLLE